MAAVNEAWRVLSDRSLRADYDRLLDGPTPPPKARPAPPPQPAPRVVDDLEELDESTEPLTYSAGWTRRWALGVGVLTMVGFGFFMLLVWIALGGFD